jgi:hypothetical protein
MARPTQDTQPSRERWRIMMLSSSPSTHHITRTGFHSFLFCDAIGHQRISFRILIATIHQRPILKRSQECPRRVSQSPTNRTSPHERRHSSHGRRVVVLASTTRWLLLLSSQPATMPQLSLYAPIYLHHHHRDTAAATSPTTTTTLHVSQQQHFHNGTDRSQQQRTTRIRWYNNTHSTRAAANNTNSWHGSECSDSLNKQCNAAATTTVYHNNFHQCPAAI